MRVFCVIASLLALSFLASSEAGAKRLAFVVGINKYDNLAAHKQLTRAVEDAEAIAGELTSLRYKVIGGKDLSRSEFNEEWQDFVDNVEEDDTLVIFLSGHNVEINGRNFLLPRDLPPIMYGREEQLKRESISVNELLEDLAARSPHVTILILDACRENPLVPDEFKGSTLPGLAAMDSIKGTFIMYSAAAKEMALDRLTSDDGDKHSVYVRKLLPLMRAGSRPLPELAVRLRDEVYELADSVGHVQRPAYYDGVLGSSRLCFGECAKEEPAPAGVDPELEVALVDKI
jgi:Caspase domain